MGKHEKLLLQILRGTSDANIAFDDLVSLLTQLGFEMRVRGSHHVFRREGIPEMVNLQKQGAQAKPYQVRQVRLLIVNNRLAGGA